MKKKTTRNNIIDAAFDAFFDKGVQNTTIAELAKTVGITQPAIYRHFSGMTDILVACAVEAAVRGRRYIDSRVDALAGAREQLRAYIQHNLLVALKLRKECSALAGMYFYSSTVPEICSLHKKINDEGMKRIEVILAAGNREGAWVITDTGSAARLIHSVLVGEMLKAMLWPRALSEKNRIEQVTKFILNHWSPRS